MDSLDIMIGQMIMVGLNNFDDTDNRESILASIGSGQIGGIILFEKDLKKENTKPELARLVKQLQEASSIPLFIGIDEEGGRVNRLKPKYGFPKTVSAQYLGSIKDLDSTFFYSDRTARNLYDFGFNVNYAPNVDVNINPKNPVIGSKERSFSGNYEEVIRHANKVIESHDQYDIATVLKHFPGHGSSAKDSHLGVTDVSDTWVIEELYPYKSLIDSGKVSAIMSAHVVNRTLDTAKLPASLSRKVMKELLRDQLGFKGVIFSDDMHMGAISKNYGLEEAIVLAVNATMDVLMFSNNVFDDEKTSGLQVHQVLKQKVISGEISLEIIKASYDRIMELKRSLGLLNPDYLRVLRDRLESQL